MTIRVGIIEPYCKQASPAACVLPTKTFICIEQAFKRHHVRVETLFYSCEDDLDIALQKKEIHVAYDIDPTIEKAPDSLKVRNQQLYDILQPQISENVRLSLIAFEDNHKNSVKTIHASDTLV